MSSSRSLSLSSHHGSWWSDSVCLAVFNLCQGVDVEATKEKMECYRRDHQTMIMKNRERQVRACLWTTECASCPSSPSLPPLQHRQERVAQQEVREEQQLQEMRNRRALAAAQEQARVKERDKQSIIHELVRSVCVMERERCGVGVVSDGIREASPRSGGQSQPSD